MVSAGGVYVLNTFTILTLLSHTFTLLRLVPAADTSPEFFYTGLTYILLTLFALITQFVWAALWSVGAMHVMVIGLMVSGVVLYRHVYAGMLIMEGKAGPAHATAGGQAGQAGQAEMGQAAGPGQPSANMSANMSKLSKGTSSFDTANMRFNQFVTLQNALTVIQILFFLIVTIGFQLFDILGLFITFQILLMINALALLGKLVWKTVARYSYGQTGISRGSTTGGSASGAAAPVGTHALSNLINRNSKVIRFGVPGLVLVFAFVSGIVLAADGWGGWQVVGQWFIGMLLVAYAFTVRKV